MMPSCTAAPGAKRRKCSQRSPSGWGEVGLRLHPDKTRIVYCKDGRRRGDYEHASFAFLGFTFRARKAIDKNGEMFHVVLARNEHRGVQSQRR